MKLVYNLVVSLLRFVYQIASLFNPKAKLFLDGRKNLFAALQSALKGNSSPIVWLHCASLGEFEQGRPVMEKLKNEFPSHKILLTFFSPSGYEVRKKYDKADYIFYLPWDTKNNAKQFIEIAKPSLAIFIKYEFWHHYTTELKKGDIPILSVSAIFRANQLFFKGYGKFYRQILEKFNYFFVQNDDSVKLLKSIGIQNCIKAGDTRFDRVYGMVNQGGGDIPIAKQFKGNEKVMVIGSCWPEDMDALTPFINEQSKNMKFIIAPHEISESFIQSIEKTLNTEPIRYSKAKDNVQNFQVMIIDNIGMLGKLYKYGEFAFIGGAFGKGLHNILEAACYGIPIFFGNKNYKKFQEAVDLINRGGAFEIADYRDLKDKYEMTTLPQNFLLACEVTRQYVQENLGATDKVMDYCRKTLQS